MEKEKTRKKPEIKRRTWMQGKGRKRKVCIMRKKQIKKMKGSERGIMKVKDRAQGVSRWKEETKGVM